MDYARELSVKRFLLLFAAMFIGMSIAAGSIAHAMEPLSCIDEVTAQSMGHSPSDGDQVPGDVDNSHPHHHGSCHSHQMADRVNEPRTLSWIAVGVQLAMAEPMILPVSQAAPSLRPPIA